QMFELNSWRRTGTRPYPVREISGSEGPGKYPVSRCDINGDGRTSHASLFRELLSHQAMQQVDGFQRTYHHLEVRDPIVIAERDDVDAVDPDALDLVL